MDDFVFFSNDRRHLVSIRADIGGWLAERRGLELNPKHQAVLPSRAPGVFLGYRLSPAGISPSRKLRRRMKRRLILAAERDDEALVRSIRSYWGLLCFPWV